jgi:4'-phosphopantetheinyl transferase
MSAQPIIVDVEDPVLSHKVPLATGEVHLWLCDYADIGDKQLLDAYRTLLNEGEKEQESRFYFERDRRRYLVTRALVRTVLSRYEPIEPKDWRFCVNAYGCPKIESPERVVRLSFNISHAHSLIVLGVADGRALGVDVENVLAREVSIDIADNFFSPTEVAALAGVPTTRQHDRFFEYWTFKESYIKARGMGLSIPLDKFSFQYPHDGVVQIAIDPALADDPRRWKFWQFRPTPEYLVAVCADREQSRSMAVVVREIVPLQVEKLYPHTLSRMSK